MVVDPKEIISFLDWLPGRFVAVVGRRGMRGGGSNSLRLDLGGR